MEIVTERLILRTFEESDVSDVYEYLKEPTVHCFYDMKPDSMEALKEEIRNRKSDEFYLAIVLKDTGKVIGELFGGVESTDPTQEDTDTFSPCWMLHPDYQGKGYAYEAVHAYFDWLFYEKNVRRLYAFTEDYNRSSQKLCERLGMREEGEFLEFVSFIKDENGNPVYENTWQYAILKKEWESK